VNVILDGSDAAPASQSHLGVPATAHLTTQTPDALNRQRTPAQLDVRAQSDEPSLGELKAQHRELHLCLRCTHHVVCGMAKSLDPNLLVTIATCLGFEPADSDDSNAVCELLPLAPLSDHITDPLADSCSDAARRSPP
jgi:hypothetical protein